MLSARGWGVDRRSDHPRPLALAADGSEPCPVSQTTPPSVTHCTSAVPRVRDGRAARLGPSHCHGRRLPPLYSKLPRLRGRGGRGRLGVHQATGGEVRISVPSSPQVVGPLHKRY